MTWPIPHSTFEQQLPAGISRRNRSAVDTPGAMPDLPLSRSVPIGSRLFAAVALGGLAYLVLTGGLTTIVIVAGILAGIFACMVACLIWGMGNIAAF